MVDMAATHPLDQFFAEREPHSGDGVTIRIITGRGIAQVFATKQKVKSVEGVLKIKQTPGQASVTPTHTGLPISPRQWILVSAEKEDGPGFSTQLQSKLGKNGYVSEQSDSRVIFNLSGPRVVELMQKGCRLDLHPSVTGPNWCGQTQIAQVSVLIHQLDNLPTYNLYVYSGFARDFAEWLEHTGAQLGIGFLNS